MMVADRRALPAVALLAVCALAALANISSRGAPVELISMDPSSGMKGSIFLPESIPWKFPTAGPWGEDPHKLSSVEYMPANSSDWYWHPRPPSEEAAANATEEESDEEDADEEGGAEEEGGADESAAEESEEDESEDGEDVGVEDDEEASTDEDTEAATKGRPTMLVQRRGQNGDRKEQAKVTDALAMASKSDTYRALQRAAILGCKGVHYAKGPLGEQLVSPCASQEKEFTAMKKQRFTDRADLGTVAAGTSPDFEGHQYKMVHLDHLDAAGDADSQFLARDQQAPHITFKSNGQLNLFGNAADAADDDVLQAVSKQARKGKAPHAKVTWHTW
jgi:hypothetical protein